MIDVNSVFLGRDGDATRALYQELLKLGISGEIAVNLLRIAKNSRGGKNRKYRGHGRRAAYETKDWAIGELCRALVIGADDLGINWGWGFDKKAIGYEHVLYVELPGQGQVSFHTHSRRDGPDYAGTWDGVKDVSARRVVGYAQFLINGGGEHDEGNRTSGEGSPGNAGAEVGGAQQEALDL